jgi:formyl-CoA transferase
MEKSAFYADARTDLTGPLHGIRVLDITTSWAGPMAGCVLADLGADVIKVELPGGEVARVLPPNLPGTELSFVNQAVNRNKRSLTLDLRTPRGKELFLELVAHVDVVVENFRCGTLESWGLGYRHCQAVKPDIVYVSITGWGQYGPLCDRAGYDPAAQAYSGWMSLNGEPDSPPVKAATWIGDDIAGLHGAIGALGGLRHRAETGEGQHVDVALLDALIFQSNGFPILAAMGYEVPRMGSQVGQAVPINTFACQDGFLFLTVVLDAHWAILAKLMGRTELADAPGFATVAERVNNRTAVNAVVADWCADHTLEDAIAQMAGAGLTVSRINTLADLPGDPHLIEREVFQPTTLEDGTVAPLIAPPARFSRTPTRVRHGAAALGAHSGAVLAELGYSPTQIEELRANAII